jgi:hypothetical protein
MALNDNVFSGKLLQLYKEMEEKPMPINTFADRMAGLLDTQTKTAEVAAGISVNIPITSQSGSPSTGQTTSKGSLA